MLNKFACSILLPPRTSVASEVMDQGTRDLPRYRDSLVLESSPWPEVRVVELPILLYTCSVENVSFHFQEGCSICQRQLALDSPPFGIFPLLLPTYPVDGVQMEDS